MDQDNPVNKNYGDFFGSVLVTSVSEELESGYLDQFVEAFAIINTK